MKDLNEFCRILEGIELTEVIIAQNLPKPPQNLRHLQIFDFPRLIIPLSGTKKITFGGGSEVVTTTLRYGQILCIPSNVWDTSLWELPHKMISLVFRKSCLRVIYIDFNPEIDLSPPEPDFFYHLYSGASSATTHAMLALANSDERIDQDLLQFLTKCTLRLTCNDLRQKEQLSMSRAYTSYINISEYIITNINSKNMTRHDVAKYFKLTPEHVSYLFKTFSKKSFNDFVTECKINLASNLLLGSNMTIDEIAEVCHYNYTSYFIKMFRRYHGISPAKYRIVNKNLLSL
jgi:AraC-like DNA-binding protein